MNHILASERGQAIVLLVVALVGLLGFTALAIDGGMVYSDRRSAQNAADAAALAGALALLDEDDGLDWDDAAFARAASNGFETDADTVVMAFHPPEDGPYAGADEYVQVKIQQQTRTALIHMVYSGGVVTNAVSAVARARPTTDSPFFFGNAIVGLAPHGRGVVNITGNAGTSVTGAGVWVNSDASGAGGDAFEIDGGSNLTLTGGQVSVVGGYDTNGNLTPANAIQGGATQIPYPLDPNNPAVSPPNPAADCDYTVSSLTLGADTSPGLTLNGNTLTLQTGKIFCVTGQTKWNASDVVRGTDVVIVITLAAQGSGTELNINAKADVSLNGPNSGPYAGMLFYVEPDYGFNYNSPNANPPCDLSLEGGAGVFLTGTVFAPACDIKLTGGSNADGFHSQVIGFHVSMAGGNGLSVFFAANEQAEFQVPPMLDLAQ